MRWWLALCGGWTSARGSGGSTRLPGAVGTCHHSPYLSPPHRRTRTHMHAHTHAHMQTTRTYTDMHVHTRTHTAGHCQVGGAGSPVSRGSLVTCFARWALPMVPAPPCPPPHPPCSPASGLVLLQPGGCMLLLLLSHFSRVQLCATPSTAAHQAPPSLGSSRQEHWSGFVRHQYIPNRSEVSGAGGR